MTAVLIVGSGSPVARHLAARYRQDGEAVAGVGLDDRYGDLYDFHVSGDCSDADAADAALDQVVRAVGPLRRLIVTAGSMVIARAEDTPDSLWREAFRRAVDPVFFPIRSALQRRAVEDGGAIVALSSVNATLAAPGVAAYSAAKSSVEGLMRQIALDNASIPIRANVVAPGRIDAQGLDAAGYPMGHAPSAADVAAAVHFLASDAAAGITGHVLPVDGGLSVTSPSTFLRSDLLDRLQRREDS